MSKVKRNKKGFWTKDKCKNIASKYSSRMEFSNKSRTCYVISARNGWLNDICSHMEVIKKPNGYWSFENCKEVALKCVSPTDFYNKFRTAYEYARKNKWLDEIQTHMKPRGNKYKRLIYVIIFEDRHAYIGLTYNTKNRYYNHLKDERSSVYKHITKTNVLPTYIELTEFLNIEEAQKLEKFYVKKYKEEGYTILNVAKTGALGGNINKWTFDLCQKEALKYKTRNEFCVKSPNIYNACSRNNWLNDVCSHMIIKRRPNGYWTFDTCKEAAMKCKNKEDFYKKFGGGFVFSKNNGWLNDFFPKK